jgi:hypothetical protein
MEPLPVAIVCALIAVTIGITAYAKRRNLDTGDHYVAGRRLSGGRTGSRSREIRSPPPRSSASPAPSRSPA